MGLCLVAAIGLSSQASANFINNPGFESDSGPNWWWLNNWNGAEANGRVTDAEARTGRFSYEVTVTDAVDLNNISLTSAEYDLPVSKGVIHLSCWVKSAELGRRFRFILELIDNSGQPTYLASPQFVVPQGSFKEYLHSFPLPGGTTKVQALLQGGNINGTFWIDDVSAAHLFSVEDRSAAYRFNRRLGIGINFQDYQIHAGPWRPEGYHHPIDFQIIRDSDLCHVRIGGRLFDGNIGGPPGYAIDPVKLASYKNAVDWALDAGLMVVMDPLHWWLSFEPGSIDHFRRIWEQVAEEFKDYPLDAVAFELMNEPHDGSSDFVTLIRVGLEAIRYVPGNEERIVMITANGYSSLASTADALQQDQFPTDDPYVILTAHNYEPTEFTQYGLGTWGESGDEDPDWANLTKLIDAVETANLNWSTRNGTPKLPINLGENGVTVEVPDADRKRNVWWSRIEAERSGWSVSHWSLYNDEDGQMGYGPWGDEQRNDPTKRFLHRDKVEILHTRYEAEDASLTGEVEVDDAFDGFSGSGVVDLATASAGDEIKLSSLYTAKSGIYFLSIRYSNAEDEAVPLTVRTYDRLGERLEEKASVSFPSTGGTGVWFINTIPMVFSNDTENSVTITVQQDSAKVALDYLKVGGNAYYDHLYPSAAFIDNGSYTLGDFERWQLQNLTDRAGLLQLIENNPWLLDLYSQADLDDAVSTATRKLLSNLSSDDLFSFEGAYFKLDGSDIEADPEPSSRIWRIMRSENLSDWREIGTIQIEDSEQEPPFFLRFELRGD